MKIHRRPGRPSPCLGWNYEAEQLLWTVLRTLEAEPEPSRRMKGLQTRVGHFMCNTYNAPEQPKPK